MTEQEKDELQIKISELADKFGQAIQQLTGADSAIIFYAYRMKYGERDYQWRRGSRGEADIYQRMGLCQDISDDLLHLKEDN